MTAMKFANSTNIKHRLPAYSIDNVNNNSFNNNNNNVNDGQDVDILSGKEEILQQTTDNWIHRLLYGTIEGTVILVICLYFAFFTIEEPFSAFTQNVMGPKEFGYLAAFLAIEYAIAFTILYPLSRLSTSKKYYWFIGTFCTIVITFVSLLDYQANKTTWFNRFIISTEATRMTMKYVSFLCECNKSDQIHSKTTIGSFAYFLFAPSLIYKLNYPRTKSIRLTKIAYYVIWYVTFSALFSRFFFHYLYQLIEFDWANVTLFEFGFKCIILYNVIAIGYIGVVHFSYFELWCGFWAELFRFSNRKHFGDHDEFFVKTNSARAFNFVVSDFLNAYLYKPFCSETQSRFKSLFVVFTVATLYHEITSSYVCNQLVLINLPILTSIAVIIFWKKDLPPLAQFIRTTLVFIAASLFALSHSLEYFAWRSTVPGLENESKLRLIPLFYKYVYQLIVSTFKN